MRGTSIRYEYDGVGNRLKETTSSGTTDYSYGGANKLVSSSGAKAFTFNYDNNGNTIAENNKQYIYNQNQRLIKVTDTHTGTDTVLGEYLYNGNGQRVKKVANNKTTYFVYDQYGNLIEEADEAGQVNIDYIYLGSVPIARVDEWWEGMKLPEAPTGLTITPADKQLTVSWNANTEPIDGYKINWGIASRQYTNSKDVGKVTSYIITGLTNGTTYYVSVTAYADLRETYFYHTDHLGTPILMTDKNKNVVWNGEFLPYGEEYSITGNVINNFRFPGQYFDKETGLNQNWQRDYHPPTGTYRQSDPIGFLGGINLYGYTDNPINYTDPWGLAELTASPYGIGGTLAIGDWAHFNFGISGNISIGFTDSGLLVIQGQLTYYDKVLGAYVGVGTQRGGAISKNTTKEGSCHLKNQLTGASGFAWKGKGADAQLILDENEKSGSIQGGINARNSRALGAFIAGGRTETLQYAVNFKNLLQKIKNIFGN